jgi:putative ABC transport system permease protein
MRLIDSFRISKSNLSRSRARSFLTIFGVGIGVGAIIMLVSLGIGLEKLTAERIASLDMLTTINVSQKENSTPTLDDSALAKFNQIKNVEAVSASIKSTAQITYSKTTTSTIIYGVAPENLELEGASLEIGDINDLKGKSIIVSKSLLKTLGEDNFNSALGQEVDLELINLDDQNSKNDSLSLPQKITERMKIVGIDNSESMGLGYVPLDWMKTTLKKSDYDAVKVKMKNRKDVTEAKKEIEGLGFNASTVSDLISQVESIFLVIEIILGAIGGIGLFVAAIGIINTMTIALLERTHEIGVMKAVGASNADVRRIFLTESILISFLGGVLGAILGYGTGVLLNTIVHILIQMSGGTNHIELFITPYTLILGMLGLTIIIGIITGIYPARRASKLSPLEALHTE